MRANIKYLSLGLFIGIGFTALLLSGMLIPPTMKANQPTNTPTLTQTTTAMSIPQSKTTATNQVSTNTYTPTPTYILPSKTFTATNTPTVTPTVPSSTPTLTNTWLDLYQNGTLSDVGPLTIRQQISLYKSSLKFIRKTSEGSRALGEEINGKGYGAPSDICGPLTIAILQDAELVSSDFDPHTYWLLNPDVSYDRRLLDKVFPKEEFQTIRINIKLDKIDWHVNPLLPGDFVYLFAGSGGTFEHMLVVNRVDSQGRAYAVTNHNTENGFIIEEVLLYHPEKSNVGMFAVWTEYPNKILGSTGFGGLEIWRKRLP